MYRIEKRAWRMSDYDDDMGIYKVRMEAEGSIIKFYIFARSIEEATDEAYDYGKEQLNFEPEDWEDVEIIYVGRVKDEFTDEQAR
jgi:hypothetical protein